LFKQPKQLETIYLYLFIKRIYFFFSGLFIIPRLHFHTNSNSSFLQNQLQKIGKDDQPEQRKQLWEEKRDWERVISIWERWFLILHITLRLYYIEIDLIAIIFFPFSICIFFVMSTFLFLKYSLCCLCLCSQFQNPKPRLLKLFSTLQY
jgi:hypothetical protein